MLSDKFRKKMLVEMEAKLRLHSILETLNDEEFQQVALILYGSLTRDAIEEESRLDAMMEPLDMRVNEMPALDRDRICRAAEFI